MMGGGQGGLNGQVSEATTTIHVAASTLTAGVMREPAAAEAIAPTKS